MKLFQNKFFVICLCVAITLAAVPTVFSFMGYQSLSKNILGTVTYPLRFCFSAVADGFSGIGAYFQGMDALNKKNEALNEEIDAMKDKIEEAELLEEENERLREYLGLKAKFPSFTMEEGMIISHSSGNYITTFTLNRGTMHGININMPVVCKDGIVGSVTEVGLNWCMVSTIIETATSVGAYIPRSGAVGIVSGDYSLRHEGVCRISYVDISSDIIVGDTVLSSGTGSVYPADLEIGTVTKVEIDEYSRTLVATVRPKVDFSSLKWVMIITGYDNTEAEK